jgi:two-component system cell cycle response regulator
MKILIADDDRAITQVLALQLRAKGCEILLAYDAMQALMVGVRAQPDAIILDIHMPGGTGVEALRKLRASAKTSFLPIVVISATTDPKEIQTVHDLGATAFLPKPVDFEALWAVLEKATGRTGG